MLYRWLIDERMTVRQILKRLAAGPWRPRNGKRLWSNSVVHRILSDPLYAGTAYANRHVLVAPAQAPVRRPPGGPADLPQAAAARGVDPHPGAGHHRRDRLIKMRASNSPATRPSPSATTPATTTCSAACSPAGRAAWPCAASPPAGPAGGVSTATTCATARTPWPGTGRAAARSPGPRSRSSTRPSGATSSGCSTTRPRWPRSSRSGPGRPTRSTPTRPRRARSGRPSCAGSTARSSGCSTPTRPRRSTSTN